MAWGRERENVLTDYVMTFVDSRLRPNDKLLVMEEDMRIGATPDMAGEGIAGEMKTSKHPMPDMCPGLKLRGQALRYYMQVQVQIMVTGAEACVFVWEQHDDEWPTPSPMMIEHQIILPDPEAFKAIREIVDRFYGGEVEDGRAQALEELLDVQRHVTAQLVKWKLREDQVKADIIEILGDEDAAISTPLGKISWVLPKPRESFDAKAFAEAHPDLHKQFVKRSVPKSRTLRITLPKGDA